jgi:hypothetical protein
MLSGIGENDEIIEESTEGEESIVFNINNMNNDNE